MKIKYVQKNHIYYFIKKDNFLPVHWLIWRLELSNDKKYYLNVLNFYKQILKFFFNF